MKVSYVSLIAIMLVVTAVAVSGCSSSAPAAPPTTGGPQATGSSAVPSPSVSPGSSAAAVSGSDLFGGLNYNWVEYKMSAGSGKDAMTIYYKFNKQTGKCSMRFEGAGASQMPASMQDIDCSSQGTSPASTDPNEVKSDATIDCSPLEESVTVPAGTFSAMKCTTTSPAGKSTTWIAKGKFVVKMEASSGEGAVNMVLNAYG